MALDKQSLKSLRDKIELEKEETRKLEEALDLVEAKLNETPSSPLPTTHTAATPQAIQTLKDKVKSVMPSDRAFTVPELYKKFKDEGLSLPVNMPKSRLSSTLSKLVKDGVIERTHTGTGNKPHRYKVR